MAETEKKVEETKQKMKQEIEKTTQALERSQKEQEKTAQDVVESRRALHDKDQALQQKDRIIQQSEQKYKLLQQRLKEQELNPEGEFQRRIREMEKENCCLRFQRLCKICLQEEVQMVFIPCGHTVTCEDCAECLTDKKPQNQRKCPVCRKNIEGKVKIFFA